MEERVFDEMSLAVEIFVVITQRLAVLAWRNLRLHTLDLGLPDDGVAVVAFVCDQVLGCQAFDESASL